MELTPEQKAHVEAVIAEFDFSQTYFFNGMGFDPKDTLRRFAGEVLCAETDKFDRILNNADESRSDAEIVAALKAMITPAPVPAPGTTIMPPSYTLEDAIKDTSNQHHADDVLAFLTKLKAMIKPYTIDTDRDGYILEGAMQNGFETIDDDGDLYVVSAGDLMKYVKLYRDFIPPKPAAARVPPPADLHEAACPTMNDKEFIGYCRTHCTTERALFTGAQINRMRVLAGDLPATSLHAKNWYSMHAAMESMAERALARLVQ